MGASLVVVQSSLDRFDSAVLAVNRWFMILALGAMAVLVFVSVSLRYLSNAGLVWAEELSRYLMIWLTLVGTGPVLRVGGHILVDSLTEALPRSLQRVLRAIAVLLVAICSLWLIYAGWLYVSRSWSQTTPVLGIPFALAALSLPIGFALTLWHLAMIAIGFVKDGAVEASADLEPGQAVVS